MKKISHFIILFFLCTSVFVFANYDTVNPGNRSCTATQNIPWTPEDPYRECSGTQAATGSQAYWWKCHADGDNCSPKKKDDSGPNCGYNDACAAHKGSGSCSATGPWAWSTKTCRPRFNCLSSSSVNIANAHPVSPNELAASYTLSQNYTRTLVSYDDEVSGFANSNSTKCEYACNIGYVRDTIGGVTQCRLARCNANASIYLANSTPVTPAELPTTLPYTFTRDYLTTMVVNGTDTAEKCEYTCVNGYRIYDPSKPEARCSSPVNLKINITQKKNVADSITAGVSSKIPNNTDIPLFSSGQYSIDSGFFSGDSKDMGINRQMGYIDFYSHDRLNYSLEGTLKGTITISGAKFIGIDAPYKNSASLNLEPANGDYVTLKDDTTVEFYTYFTEPGDRWRLYYELLPSSDPTCNYGTLKKCIPIVCKGNIASNGLKCDNDELNLSGNLDISRVRRASISGCTAPQKCEWYCPADKPVYCMTRNECVVNADDCGCGSGKKMCGCGQCIDGNATCPATCNAQCNNDGLCDNGEGCDCSDCTNGDYDDTDHCKNGLRCTKDESKPACVAAACCPVGQGWSCDLNACANSCGTHVPSELKAGIDIPYITCDAKPGSTHFRYQISQGALSYTSGLYLNGTTVRHAMPLMNPGNYMVKCLYGDSTSSVASMVPASCTKTIQVKSSTDSTAQGCDRIYAYKGQTLSNEMMNNTAFDASFRCGSRQDITAQNFPFRLSVGSQNPVNLQSDPFNILGVGFISTQTQAYTFSGSTDIFCSVRVGDGYSTNNACKIRTCVGSDCATPQTFVVTPSRNVICTQGDTLQYDIGCNPDSPQYTDCVNWFNQSSSRTLKVANTIQPLVCTTSRPPGALSDVKTCTIQLPTGGAPVTLFEGNGTGPQSSFQTTIYSLTKDNQSPAGVLNYYTNYSAGTMLDPSQYEFWQKQPVTAVITCTDSPGKSDGGNCACASNIVESGTQRYWSSGIPNGDPKIGPDVMSYSRVISNNSALGNPPVFIQDTAGNQGPKNASGVLTGLQVNIGVDTIAPKVQIGLPAANKVNITVNDPSDGGSGLWKPASLRPLPVMTPAIQQNSAAPAILYRIFTKAAYAANPSAYEFDDLCNLGMSDNGNYYKFGELPSATATATKTLSITTSGIKNTFATTTNMIAYCVQDNAGNVTRGVYPSDPVGCFSATNMPVVPTLSTYQSLLIPRLVNSALSDQQKYGYNFSEDSVSASCFRSMLGSNINTFVINQLTPETTLDVDWSKSSIIRGTLPAQRSGQYYYYNNVTSVAPTLSATTFSSLRKITTSPTGVGSKVVIADGENIQINANIYYSGSNNTLVIIARKNAKGGGGNILIDPSVTRIDAILIADGGIINAQNGVLKNSITDAALLTNRLVINGRLYSFNTRGGSVVVNGSSLNSASGVLGKFFNNDILSTTTTTTIKKAYEQDLERFRMILNDGNATCSLSVNYQLLSTSNLPQILQRPANFTGGACSF